MDLRVVNSLQILCLKSAPELHALGYDSSVISQQALDLWFLDGAALAEPPASPPITEDVDAGNDDNTVAELG